MSHEIHEAEQGYDDNFVMLYHDQMDVLVASAKSTTTMVFLAILRRANRNNGNTCFPSLDTIAKESGVSRRTVSPAIKELVDLRLLTVTHRTSESGDATSNLYRVLRPSANSAKGSAKSAPTPRAKSAPPVGQNLPSNKTKSEPDEFEPYSSVGNSREHSDETESDEADAVMDAFAHAIGLRSLSSTNRPAAEDLVQQGFAPEDIAPMVQWFRTDPFWSQQSIGLSTLAKHGAKWKASAPAAERWLSQEELAQYQFADWKYGVYEIGYTGHQAWLADKEAGTLPQLDGSR